MNKRISKKLAKMAPVRDFTVQEAFDKVAAHLARTYPNQHCFFLDTDYRGFYEIHYAYGKPFLISSQSNEQMDLEPEEVTFYCKDCGDEMIAQTDIANEGLCDPCNRGQNEMWAKEHTHQEYEYWNSKL